MSNDLHRAHGYYVQDYLLHLSVERSLGRRTIEEYERDLEVFFNWLEPLFSEGMTLPEIDPRTLREFLAYLRQKKGYTASGLNRKIACLKGYFTYLEMEKILAASPMARIRSAKEGKLLPKVLTQDEVGVLLDTVDECIAGVTREAFALARSTTQRERPSGSHWTNEKYVPLGEKRVHWMRGAAGSPSTRAFFPDAISFTEIPVVTLRRARLWLFGLSRSPASRSSGSATSASVL